MWAAWWPPSPEPGIAFSLSAASIPGTAVSLFFFGIAVGLWDVAQNIEGADVEHRLRRTVMPQLHAAFSGGAFVGALVGAGLSTIGVDLPLHLLVIVAVVLVVTMVAPRYFLPHISTATPAGEPKPAKGPSAWRDSRTLLIGVVVLGATLTEGAGNDWIAKASVDGLGTSESTGALMFALFVLAMTGMRFLGGRVIDKYGRVAVLRASMAAAAAGLCLFVLAGNIWLAAAGAALWGVGAALAFPMGMSAAADDPAPGGRPGVRGVHPRLRVVPGRPAAAWLPWRRHGDPPGAAGHPRPDPGGACFGQGRQAAQD